MFNLNREQIQDFIDRHGTCQFYCDNCPGFLFCIMLIHLPSGLSMGRELARSRLTCRAAQIYLDNNYET